MIKNLIILTLCLIPSLLIYGYINENGDMNAGGMYLAVLFIPCLLAIIATGGLTRLTQLFSKAKIVSYLIPLILLIIVMFYPTENQRSKLAATIIVSMLLNFGLTEINEKKTAHNRVDRPAN